MASLYEFAFPTLVSVLTTQKELLKKAQEHATEKGIPTSELVEARLYEDMYPLATQVVITATTARETVTQLTGKKLALLERRDLTLDECLAALDESIQILEDVKPESIGVKETDTVALRTPSREIPMSAEAFVKEYAIPNSFFHLNMSYAILRMKGVPVGKRDYLKSFWKTINPSAEPAAAAKTSS